MKRALVGVCAILFLISYASLSHSFSVAAQESDTIEYEYDDLGRLIKVQYVEKGVQYDFRYDKAGNREEVSIGGLDGAKLRLSGAIAFEDASQIQFVVTPNYIPTTEVRFTWTLLSAAQSASLPLHVGSGYDLATDGGDLPYPQSAETIMPVGAASVTVTVSVTNDSAMENIEVVYVQISDPVNATIDPEYAVQRGVIYDDDRQPFEIEGGSSVDAGDAVTYTIRRLDTSTVPLSVDYQTTNGTASSPGDYTAKNGTHEFSAAGTKTVTVPTASAGAGKQFSFSVFGQQGGATVTFDSVTTQILSPPPPPPPNNRPVANDDPYGADLYLVNGSVTATFDVTNNDEDLDPGDEAILRADAATLSMSSGYLPPQSMSVDGNGDIVATFTKCGNYHFKYFADDGKDLSLESAELQVYVNVDDTCDTIGGEGFVNRDAVVANETYNVDIYNGSGNSLADTYSVLDNDYDPDGHAIGIVSVETVDGYEAPTSLEGGAPEYPPMAGIYATITKCGVYKIRYGVQESGNNAVSYGVATINATSSGSNCTSVGGLGRINIAPTANDDTYSELDIWEGGDSGAHLMTEAFNVLANDTDPDIVPHGDSLRVTSVSVSNGYPVAPVTISPDGKHVEVTFRKCGFFQFDYTIEDDAGESSSATLWVHAMSTSSGPGGVSCPIASPPPGGGGETPPVFSVDDVTVSEGGNMVFTVTKTGSVAYTYSVDYATSTGSASAADFSMVSGQLSFANNEYQKTITVPTVQDEDFERHEDMYLNLSNSSGGATISDAQGQGTINNDDGEPIVNVWNNNSFEGDSGSAAITLTIYLIGGSQEPVTLTYKTVDVSATAGQDYTAVGPTTVTIPVGMDRYEFTVDILGDTMVEPEETFDIEVTDLTNARWVASGVTEANPEKGTNGTFRIKNDDEAGTWYTGPWSSWSPSCGNQSKTRQVYCQNSSGAQVANSQCNGSKPDSTRTRTTTCYSYSWKYSSWGSWTGTCGSSPTPNQFASRSVWCERNDGATVSSSYCGGGKPDDQKSRTCRTYAFQYGAWSGWQGTCGSSPAPNQTRTRSATCVRSPDGTVMTLSRCGTPNTTDTRTCYTYSWYVGGWSSWSSCAGATQTKTRTRAVYCRRSPGGAQMSDSKCSGTKPYFSETLPCSGGGGYN